MTHIEAVIHPLNGQTIQHHAETFTINSIDWAVSYPSERLSVTAEVTHQNDTQVFELEDFDGHFAYITDTHDETFFKVCPLALSEAAVDHFKSQLFNNIVDAIDGNHLTFEAIHSMVDNAFYHIRNSDHDLAGTLVVVPYKEINIGVHFGTHHIEGIYTVDYNNDWVSATGQRVPTSHPDIAHTDDPVLSAAQAIHRSLSDVDRALSTEDHAQSERVLFTQCY